jgi:hypothetical protein
LNVIFVNIDDDQPAASATGETRQTIRIQRRLEV